MDASHEAIRRYRRRSLEDVAPEPLRAMFVLCSEAGAAAELVVGLRPALVLQALGGLRVPVEPGVRETFQHALVRAGVRVVFLCGHAGSAAAPIREGGRGSSPASLAETARALVADATLGPLLREHRVAVRALWFDEPEGDVYACGIDGEPPRLLSDRDLQELLALARREPS